LTLTATQTYHGNLAALRVSQPVVAEKIDSTPIPANVRPATGRDGTNTLQVPGEDGSPIWFGRSSMPSVSTAETCAGFVSNGRNAVLPGVLTGMDPIAVAGRMPSHTALFVVEENPLHVKLAMHLYNYAELIAGGRLVFLLTQDLEEHLRILLEAHPGYEVPAQLLMSPQRLPAQIAELQRQLESAGKAVSHVHNRVVESCAANIRSRTLGPLPPSPRVAVLSVDARPTSHEQAHRIGRALAKLSWPHEVCVPDDPRKCHIAARLQAIDRVSADVVLLINSSPGVLGSILPPGLPVVSWHTPGASVPSIAGDKLANSQTVCVSSRRVAAAMKGAGVAADAVCVCEPCADDTAYRPIDIAGEDETGAECDVALLADLPDDRAEACGIALASHRVLWQAIQETVSKNTGCYRETLAGQLVDEAQAASGVKLQDASIRDHFVNLVRGRIAPARIARAAVQTLARCADSLAVWGDNWHEVLRGQEAPRGRVPSGKALNRVFQTARLVVLPDSSDSAIQTALDALAAGVPVACRAPDEPFDQEYPGLAPLMPHMHLYRTERELGDTVRRLKSQDRATTVAQVEAARTAVLARHTVSHRVLAIIDHLRRRA